MKDPRQELPGEQIRTTVERLMSKQNMDRLVIPVLADLQHEASLAMTGPRWKRAFVLVRGYLAVWTTFALCFASWPARSRREDWSGLDASGPRLVRVLAPRIAVVGLLVTLTMALDQMRFVRRVGDPWVAILLLPGILTVAVPIGFLLGLVLAVARSARESDAPVQRWLGAVMGLSVAASLFSFALYAWVTPPANQSYRERVFRWIVSRDPHYRPDPAGLKLAKGSRELTMGELSARIAEGRAQKQQTAHWEVEWHKKLAIPAACLVFGPLAIALSGARSRPRLILTLPAAVGGILLMYVALRIGEQAGIAGIVEPMVGIWVGHAVLALATLWQLVRPPMPLRRPLGDGVATG